MYDFGVHCAVYVLMHYFSAQPYGPTFKKVKPRHILLPRPMIAILLRMKWLAIIPVLLGGYLFAADPERPEGAGPPREPVVSPVPSRTLEPRNPNNYEDAWFEHDRLPVMFDISYSFRSNFDAAHWHGPNVMTRLRADDLWGGPKWQQLALRSKLEWGVLPGLDASRMQITVGYVFGEDFGSNGSFRTGIKPFPHTRQEDISYGIGIAIGGQGSTETRNDGSQSSVVLESWQYFGYSIAELHLGQVLKFNTQDSIGVEGEFTAQLHIGRPAWVIAVYFGYTWQQYQRGGGSFFEAGIRLAI